MVNYWEKIYLNKKHLSIWPWSDLVSNFENFSKITRNTKVFEIGCGAGANIPYFLKKKLNYFGCDFSPTAIKKLEFKYKLKKKIFSKSYLDLKFKKDTFNYIIDRASVTHNSSGDIQKILQKAHFELKKNGIFFGIDWYSVSCSDYQKLRKREKFIKFSKGKFKNIGNVYFSSSSDMKLFFKKFKILKLEEKVYICNKTSNKFASWIVVAKKK